MLPARDQKHYVYESTYDTMFMYKNRDSRVLHCQQGQEQQSVFQL